MAIQLMNVWDTILMMSLERIPPPKFLTVLSKVPIDDACSCH